MEAMVVIIIIAILAAIALPSYHRFILNARLKEAKPRLLMTLGFLSVITPKMLVSPKMPPHGHHYPFLILIILTSVLKGPHVVPQPIPFDCKR